MADALSQFRTALKLDKENIFALQGLAECMFYLKNYNEALNYFEQCLELNKNDSTTFSGIGWIHFQTQNYPLAKENMQKALDISSDHLNLYRMGCIEYESDLKKESLVYFFKYAKFN
jgi:tetratricopeptide (TPR) repeat protein